MIDLSCVTLVCFENRDHKLALSLIKGMCDLANFGDVRLMNLHADYQGFLKAEAEVHKTVHTSHMLFVHLDGYIVHPEMWDPKWLEYDYIGAPWPEHLVNNPKNRVGNGGFSLRTVDLAKASLAANWAGMKMNQDVLLCQVQREIHEDSGYKWAPIEEAAKFSIEFPCPESRHPTFGFHSTCNYPLWGGEKTI